MAYYILMKDEGALVLSSKTFDQYVAAVAYARTVAPSREARVVKDISRFVYNEETGEGVLEETMCPTCCSVQIGEGRFCTVCGGHR